MQQDVADLTDKMQAAWDAAALKPQINRWVVDRQAADSRPKRQKELRDITKKLEEDQVDQDPVTGVWMLTRNKKTLPIVTVDALCRLVAEKYLSLGSRRKVETVLEKEYAGIIRNDVRLLLTTTLPDAAPTTSAIVPGQTYSVVDDPYNEQERIFSSESLQSLRLEWEQQKDTYPVSHIASLAEVGTHILDAGHAARPYIPPLSTNGTSEWSYDDADYLLFTEHEYTQWLLEERPPRVVVIRDKAAESRKALPSTEEYLTELALMEDHQIDVQRFDASSRDLAVELMAGKDVHTQWNRRDGSSPPMNLLNLVDYSMTVPPDAFTTLPRCMLLRKACQLSDSKLFGNIRGLQPKAGEESESRGPGKKPAERYTLTDIKNCQSFRIMAQRGSISGWHADVMGNITYVRVAGQFMQGSPRGTEEKDSDTVKLWPFFPMDKFSPEEKKSAMKEFAKNGPDWKPTPANGIPVLALVKGDTIIMPPGTIHAPITLTDVSMAGGMCMDERQLPQHIEWWYFLSKNPDCTNERRPKQTYAVLSMIQKWVHISPTQFNVMGEGSLETFDSMVSEICGEAIRCGCTRECSNCSCIRFEVPCGIKCNCHRKRNGCPNEVGRSKWT